MNLLIFSLIDPQIIVNASDFTSINEKLQKITKSQTMPKEKIRTKV